MSARLPTRDEIACKAAEAALPSFTPAQDARLREIVREELAAVAGAASADLANRLMDYSAFRLSGLSEPPRTARLDPSDVAGVMLRLARDNGQLRSEA